MTMPHRRLAVPGIIRTGAHLRREGKVAQEDEAVAPRVVFCGTDGREGQVGGRGEIDGLRGGPGGGADCGVGTEGVRGGEDAEPGVAGVGVVDEGGGVGSVFFFYTYQYYSMLWGGLCEVANVWCQVGKVR